MTKKNTTLLITMLAIILILLVLGTFLDMNISDNLYNGDKDVLDMLGGFLGKLPGFILLAVAFAILMNYVYSHADVYKKGVRIVLYIFYGLCVFASFLLAFYSAFEEMTSKAKYIAVVAGAIATCIAVLLAFKKEMRHADELKKWALLTILAVGIVMVLVVGIKEVWGRERYVDIMASGKEFTPWYHPNGFGGGHSFPSGHTAMWGTLFMVLPLFGILGYKGEGFIAFSIIATNLLVGLFRIIGGHHFLSDVAVSMLISFCTCFVVSVVGYKKDYSNKTLSPKNIFNRI